MHPVGQIKMTESDYLKANLERKERGLFLDMRIWRQEKPDKEGLVLSLEVLPDLIRLLERAVRMAGQTKIE